MRAYRLALRLVALAALAALLSGRAAASGAARPTLVIGGDHKNPPYEYLDAGEPTGFNVELMRAAAAVAGFEVDIRLGPWSKVRRDLELGNVDALSGMYYSEERTELVEFSVPHTMVRSALFVRDDSPIRSFDDLRGREVILQEGDVRHDLLKRMALASRIIAVTDADEQLRVLASGRGDAALMTSRLQGEYYVRRHELTDLRVIDAGLPQLRYCFAVRKGNRELLYRLDEALNVLAVTGKYRQIYERWFGVHEGGDLWEYSGYFALALVAVSALFALSILWSRSLQRLVTQRTAALQAREEELRRAHAELELRVEERTAELKRANEQLRESEEWLKLAIEATGAATLQTRPYAPARTSARMRQMLGIADDHVLDFESFLRLVHPADRDMVRESHERAVDPSCGQPMDVEFRCAPPDGGIRWIAFKAKAQFAEDGGAPRAVRLAAVALDVTARKREEQALRESEERFHTLADNIAQLAWMAGPSGKITWFNRRCFDYTGATADALHLGRYIHPEHIGYVAVKMSRCLSTGKVFEASFPLRGRDGSYRWFLSRAVPVRGPTGQVERWLGTATDVTELRAAEEALRASEARGRAILASLSEGVVFHGPDGLASTSNDAALQLLGLTLAELTGRSPLPAGWGAIRSDCSPLPDEEYPVHRALRTGLAQRDIEVGVRRPDGTVVWLSVNAEPVWLSPGSMAGVVSSLFDITQRRQALLRSEEHLRIVADNVPDAIVRFDRELRHAFANAAAASAIGVPLERIAGRTNAELGAPPEHVASWDRHLREAFRTGSPQGFELGPAGRGLRYYESRLVPELDRDGAVDTVLSITRDITERKRAEHQLLESREQLRALVARLDSVREEEKARISRELHDEMGQLLTALRMELEELEDGLGDRAPEGGARELLDRAVAASELVAKAIDSMRNVLASLRPAALDRLGLDAALRQECRRFEDWAGVACELAAPEGPSTFGTDVDTALFRIGQEALTNVARHARASRVAVTLERIAETAVLQVADDGCGIPPGQVSAGLGILGMRERAERLDGELVLRPLSPAGTVVEARIPLGGPSRKNVS